MSNCKAVKQQQSYKLDVIIIDHVISTMWSENNLFGIMDGIKVAQSNGVIITKSFYKLYSKVKYLQVSKTVLQCFVRKISLQNVGGWCLNPDLLPHDCRGDTWSLIHKAQLHIWRKFWKFSLLKYTQFYNINYIFYSSMPSFNYNCRHEIKQFVENTF